MSRAERIAWAAGGVGCVVAAIGWAMAPRDFAYGWLAALATWIGWPLGSIALLLTHALTGGRWGDALRPALLAGIVSLVLLIPALIPYAITADLLYPWMHPGGALANRFYLNVPFLVGRSAAYLIVWLGLGALVLRGASLARIAPPGLILLAFTVTFAAIDATMSLDPTFESSIYGMLAAAAVGLLALAIAVLAAVAAAPEDALADFGKLLLALVVLWAYLDFMQLLIVWQSNLSADAPWYARRMHGGWGWVLAALAIGHFLLPFALLIIPRLQRNRRALAGVAILLIAMAVLRSWWLVLPEGGRSVGWIDLACLCAFGGLAAGITLRAPLRRRGARHV